MCFKMDNLYYFDINNEEDNDRIPNLATMPIMENMAINSELEVDSNAKDQFESSVSQLMAAYNVAWYSRKWWIKLFLLFP